MLGAKIGYCSCPLHSTPPKGWAKYLSHPSCWTPGHSPALVPYKEPAHPHLREQAIKGSCCLFSLPQLKQGPRKSLAWPLVNFLSGLCCSVTKLCPTLCDLIDWGMPGFPVLHCLPHFTQTHVHWVSDAIQPSHLLFCGPLLLLPSIFLSIRVFSNELALCIRWPRYWSFSFRISPSKKYSGLISFRTD